MIPIRGEESSLARIGVRDYFCAGAGAAGTAP